MRNIHILFLITAAVVLGCKKKTPITHVSGIVVNIGTKQPVTGALVVIQDGVGNNTGGLFPGSSNVGSGATQQITTGANGHFNFDFQGEAPFIWVEKEQYRFVNPNGAFEIYSLSAGKTYTNLQLTLVAYAWFNPILKGHNCVSTDIVWIVGGSSLIPPMGGGYLTFNGNGPTKFSEAGRGLLASGDWYYPYGIKWQEHGVWQAGRIDSVYIKSFTTYTDTIYY
jgi:hypothetical protein